MRKAFKISRLIGLLAIVLGLMAFGATAAQAEPNAYWEVEGTKIEGASNLLPEINAVADSAVSKLVTTVGKTKVEILCSEIKFVGAKLHTLGQATGKIHYQGCNTSLNGGAHAGLCKPNSPGAASGLIETNALIGLIKLHTLAGGAKDDLVELKPVTGSFVTIEMPTCSIGKKFDITGVAFLKDCKTEGLVNLAKHLFEEGPLTALFFGGNAATIEGSAWGFLEGTHVNQVFSGHPN